MASSATDIYRAARDLLQDLSADYAKAVSEFVWPDFGAQFNWAVDWFDAIARGNRRTALWIVEEDGSEATYSFDEMARRSDQAAAHLAAHGVARGDRVLLMLDNQVELWEAMLAVMKIGAVILPTTTALGPLDLVDRIDRGGVRHVLVNTSDTTKFDAVAGDYNRFVVGEAPQGWVSYRAAYDLDVSPAGHPGTAPGDPQLLYFTSGTTSRPKLVEHTQVSYPVGHLATSFWIGAKPGDTHLNISSPGWAKHAWSCFFAPWIAEATIFIYNYTRFDAAALLKQIRRAGVNTFCAPPTVWRMLIKADLTGGPGELRELLSAGEPLNPEVMDQVEKAWGLTIRDGYGQTELPLAVGNIPGMPVKPGSMGLPLPGVPIVLVDPLTGEPGEEGELCVDLSRRPMSLMAGYAGDPERNAAAMEGGYYHTGDVASRDQEGYIFYIGRTDDVFKASDYKISPFELESVLIEHPAVAEAAIVPSPDELRLAVPKAYVALAPGYPPSAETALAILQHARENLAPYQRVRRIEFFELPKTISGKIRRVDLRGREEQAAAGQIEVTEWRDDQFPELGAVTAGAAGRVEPRPQVGPGAGGVGSMHPEPATAGVANVLVRLRALDACAISDALDALGLAGAALGLHCLTGRQRVAGRAVTIDLVEAGQTDSHARHLGTAAVDASGTGDVLVVAHHGRTHVSGWGGVLCSGAARNGVEGVIVDGAVRDVDEAADLELPVFAATGVPVTARGRIVERAWNVDIEMAGVTVRPGDFVLADGSGVVFVPAAEIEAVLAKAEAVAAKERAMVAKVREGTPMVDVMGADYENLLKG